MKRVSTNSEGLSVQLEALPLSKSEMRVTRLIAWGLTDKEIAEKLFISPLTVMAHRRNIYRELGIHKETDLTRWYFFKEYCIKDNPFKKIMAALFLVLSISMTLYEQGTVRVFRSMPMRTIARVVRPVRARRYANVFALKISIA
jgi:DNA-binding CsgD family transcriptional regulator